MVAVEPPVLQIEDLQDLPSPKVGDKVWVEAVGRVVELECVEDDQAGLTWEERRG